MNEGILIQFERNTLNEIHSRGNCLLNDIIQRLPYLYRQKLSPGGACGGGGGGGGWSGGDGSGVGGDGWWLVVDALLVVVAQQPVNL